VQLRPVAVDGTGWSAYQVEIRAPESNLCEYLLGMPGDSYGGHQHGRDPGPIAALLSGDRRYSERASELIVADKLTDQRTGDITIVRGGYCKRTDRMRVWVGQDPPEPKPAAGPKVTYSTLGDLIG
jgi:hypothetical protein